MDVKFVSAILVFLLVAWKVKAQASSTLFRKMDTTTVLSGSILNQIKLDTMVECAILCKFDVACKAYRFNTLNSAENCDLITLHPEQENFTSNHNNLLFLKECPLGWCEPADWDSSIQPVVYRSFDTEENITLHNGASLEEGKVNYGVSTDRALSQWVDFGDLTVACLTAPHTCGPEGAAVSMWMRTNGNCGFEWGLITSLMWGSQGFALYCLSTTSIRFRLWVPLGPFDAEAVIPDGWVHLVAVYLGPADGQGLTLYLDGAEVARAPSLEWSEGLEPGDGRVVVGRLYTHSHEKYLSVDIDELLFFNQVLSKDDVQKVYSMY